MADNTKIEWAHATANYVNGCSVISPGCTNCYPMRLAGTRMKNHPTRAGLTTDSKAGPVWNGTIRTNDKVLAEVLGWKRPRRIFWNAHGDLFHENVSDDIIDRQFAVMALTPHHTHMVLTKRSARMREYLSRLTNEGRTRWAADILSDAAHDLVGEESAIALANVLNGFSWWRSMPPRDGSRLDGSAILWPLPNVWLGVSVEDQARADERIPDLLATPAAIRFISAEPLLGALDLRWIAEPDDEKDGVIDALLGCNWVDGMGRGAVFHPHRPGHLGRTMTRRVCSSETDILANRKIDWVIAGGESGPGARPMHPDWVRSLRDQCAAAGVAFHFKQWGEWVPCNQVPAHGTGWRIIDGQGMARVGKARAGRLLDGRTHDEFPA